MDKKENKLYDIAIIGGGPSGMTSAIYSARYGLKTIVISKDIGGLANLSPEIENYPGYKGSGYLLMQKFHQQALEFGAEFLKEEVESIEKNKEIFTLIAGKNKIKAKTVIISSGTEKRDLGVPGEKEFFSRGVVHCTTCDAPLFKNKDVAVVGGGNSALGAVIHLEKFCSKIYLIEAKNALNREEKLGDRIKSMKNVEVINDAKVTRIKGEKVVKSLVYEKGGKETEISLSGVFVEVGYIPKTDFFKGLGLETDEKGFIRANQNMETNISGIFAAGDAISSKLKQVVVAAGQGAIAAKSAFDYLEKE